MPHGGPRTWRDEAEGSLRALGGAFLFGVPLLYTMEMWWIGQSVELWKLLAFLGGTFLINLYLAASTGFMPGGPGLSDFADQAVDAVAVGLVSAAAVLAVLNRFGENEPLRSMLGMVIIQAIPLSIGASIANSVLGAGEDGEHETREGDGEHGGGPGVGRWRAALADLGATLAGGLFIGLSVAPTEEIPMLAAEMGPWHLLALMGLSLLATYIIVFEAGFGPERPPRNVDAPLQRPIPETAAAYIVALLTAAAVLFLFGRITADDPIPSAVSQTVVLAFPVAIGGAAGRLVL